MKLPITFYLVKPPEYLFHLLGGRFLPQGWRLHVYSACSSYIGAGIFYLTLLACTSYMVFRFRWMNRPNQLAGFLFFWLLLSMALVSTLWFPERLLIIGDRYLYALLPPFWGIVVLLLTRRIKILLLRQGLISILLIMQMLGTLRLSLTWRQSAELTDRLQSTLTDAPDKVTILLNNPASLNGAAMIGAGSDGEARLMHNLFYSRPIRGVMFDAPAANLLGQADSIHMQQLDSRAVCVSLTRPGAFWQYGPDVAHSFGNSAFNVEVENHNCCYVLRLADTPARYRLLYQQNGNWREFHFSDK
jgi:hypothetical protein